MKVQDIYQKLPENAGSDVVFEADAEAASLLLGEGESLASVTKKMQELSPVGRRMAGNGRAFAIYMDKVYGQVNEVRRSHSKEARMLCAESYRLRARILLDKYQDYTKENFSLHQDGRIALSLIRKEHFAPDVVYSVIEKETYMPRPDSTYFFSLRSGTEAAQKAYRAIEEFDPEKNPENEADAYRKFAKRYMQQTHTLLLTPRDESRILEEMVSYMVQGYPQDTPKQEQRFEQDVEEKIKPFLTKAVREASPIAREAGRDREQYIAGVMHDFSSGYEAHIRQSSKRYPITQGLYEEKVAHYREETASFDGLHEESFYDAMIAKDLLDDRQAPQNITRALLENSQEARNFIPEGGTEEEVQEGIRRARSYAENILLKAKEALHREKGILNFEPREYPENATYAQLRSLDITPKDIYRQAMKHEIAERPSFILEMSEPRKDQEVLEKIIVRLPDIDRDALADAILEASPRAALPGADENYAHRLIRNVEMRLRIVRNRQKRELASQQNYSRMRELSTEGVIGGSLDVNAFKDGRSALKLLRQHQNRDDILHFLISMGKVTGVAVPVLYARHILEQAEVVFTREEAIRTYEPRSEGTKRTPSGVYLSKMHEKYQKRGFCQSAMDIDVAQDMLLSGEFPADAVKNAIFRYSPCAQEPGRDENYIAYTMDSAQHNIEMRKQALRSYQVIPRVAAHASCEEEYAFQKERLEEAVRLPFCREMDEKLAIALRQAGYPEEDIQEAVRTHSPLAREDESYAESLFPDPSRNVSGRQEEQVRHLMRMDEETEEPNGTD